MVTLSVDISESARNMGKSVYGSQGWQTHHSIGTVKNLCHARQGVDSGSRVQDQVFALDSEEHPEDGSTVADRAIVFYLTSWTGDYII